MLHPSNNRINFGDALRAFEGFMLDYAICTTYSLDLDAVTFLPVSLFLGEELKIEKDCTNELLNALQQVPGKVQIYCQKGKIIAPSFYHNILAFWENSIEQVHLDSYNKSFHPKIWLLRYTSMNKKKEVKYRFVCTSRNLTKSNDWDIAVTLEGVVDKSDKKNQNQPLQDFLRFLDKHGTRPIKKELMEEIPYIHFDIAETNEYSFHPIGYNWIHPLFATGYKSEELLVISPFVHTSTIQQLKNKASRIFLFSNAYELDKLTVDTCKKMDGVFQFNPRLETINSSAEETNESKDLSDTNVAEPEYECSSTLHAKLFVSKKGTAVSWYIGSANCTNSATNGNIEFLTAIHGKPSTLTPPDELVKLLTIGKKNDEGIFIPYIKKEEHCNAQLEAQEDEIRKIVYSISSAPISGFTTKKDSSLFDLNISLEILHFSTHYDWQLFLQPLSGKNGLIEEVKMDGQPQIITFTDYEESRLTPFLLFTIKEDEKLIKEVVIKIDIEFSDFRMNKILKSILNNRNRLMKYLSYLLTKDQIEPLFSLEDTEGDHTWNLPEKRQANEQFPIFEKLLIAASRDTASLKQSIDVVEALGEEKDEAGEVIVSPNFKKLLSTFKEVLPNEAR